MSKLTVSPLFALPFVLISSVSAQRSLAVVEKEARPIVGSSEKVLFQSERWKAGIDGGLEAPLVVPLGWSRGRSVLFTRARGAAVLDLAAGTLTVSVSGIGDEELDGQAELDVWLEPYAGAGSTTPAPVPLGTLPVLEGAGTMEAEIDPLLAALELEEIVVTRFAQGPVEGRILFGAPDLFQRMAGLEITRVRELSGRQIGGVPLRPPSASGGAISAGWSVAGLDDLVADGERLFFRETFGGNGRTCGTCHPAENNFTLDPEFIATLPDDDPLFVAERVPALDSSQNGGLVFESPVHMRRFGLIVENLDGFDDLRNGFVLRSVQPTLALAATIEPPRLFNQPLRHLTGWSGDGSPGRGSLREFAVGAVRQHFPKTLDRQEGLDFRLPEPGELSALEGFQLSLGRTEDPDIAALQFRDPGVRRGVETFTIEGICNFCHINGGGTTLVVAAPPGTVFLGTGVEALEQHSLDGTGLIRPVDGGFGTRPDGGFGELEPLAQGGFGNGRFNVPSLIEFADTLPAFHSHLTANPGSGLANSVEGAIEFYNTQEFVDSDVGGGILVLNLQPSDIADIGRFLRVLNALENVRTVGEYVERALAEVVARPRTDTEPRVRRMIRLALLENADALEVLAKVGLHPEVQHELRRIEARLRRALVAAPPERAAELRQVQTQLAQARTLMAG